MNKRTIIKGSIIIILLVCLLVGTNCGKISKVFNESANPKTVMLACSEKKVRRQNLLSNFFWDQTENYNERFTDERKGYHCLLKYCFEETEVGKTLSKECNIYYLITRHGLDSAKEKTKNIFPNRCILNKDVFLYRRKGSSISFRASNFEEDIRLEDAENACFSNRCSIGSYDISIITEGNLPMELSTYTPHEMGAIKFCKSCHGQERIDDNAVTGHIKTPFKISREVVGDLDSVLKMDFPDKYKMICENRCLKFFCGVLSLKDKEQLESELRVCSQNINDIYIETNINALEKMKIFFPANEKPAPMLTLVMEEKPKRD